MESAEMSCFLFLKTKKQDDPNRDERAVETKGESEGKQRGAAAILLQRPLEHKGRGPRFSTGKTWQAADANTSIAVAWSMTA